jgi:hypothetical protein
MVTVCGAAFAGRALVVIGKTPGFVPGVMSTYGGTWTKFVLLLTTEYRLPQLVGTAGPVNWIAPWTAVPAFTLGGTTGLKNGESTRKGFETPEEFVVEEASTQ